MSTEANRRPRWYDTQPERLRWELDCFRELGLPAELDTSNGFAVIRSELPVSGSSVRVDVIFPKDYPDAPPTFLGPKGLLGRHQTPDARLLCWAADEDQSWWPGMAAATIVATSIRALIEASEQGPDAVRAQEADMPEPFSGQLLTERSPVVAVPEPFLEADLPASSGEMMLSRQDDRLLLVRAAHLGDVDGGLAKGFLARGKTEPYGYWVALDPTPEARLFNDEQAWDLATFSPYLLAKMEATAKKKPHGLNNAWLGVTYMEEGPLQGKYRRNWVFGKVAYNNATSTTTRTWYPAQALTSGERQRRTPELNGLEEANLLVIGAGSLGSQVVLDLAKAGVGFLSVVDWDIFDVNNAVRHALPVQHAGENKAQAVAEFARQMNPFVDVAAYKYGAWAELDSDIRRHIRSADVVVDTTGSNQTARRLQQWCIDERRSLVIGGLSAGSYGGAVRIAEPGGPCFDCFLLHENDEAIPKAYAASPSSLVTPRGCSHPAFSGAGFDATQLAALVARVTVQASGKSGYPDVDYNWAVTNFRADPRWQAGTVGVHPACWRHG